MKLIRLLVLALGLFATGSVLAAEAKPQTVCPVLGGNINKKVYIDYQSERIYFCCQGCNAEFRKNPEKYMNKIEEQSITLEKCPVQPPLK